MNNSGAGSGDGVSFLWLVALAATWFMVGWAYRGLLEYRRDQPVVIRLAPDLPPPGAVDDMLREARRIVEGEWRAAD